MRIRPVGDEELELFVEAAGLPNHQSEIRQYLKNMFAAGSMRPEWCFLAEEGDHPVGRIAFWTLPGMEETLCPRAAGCRLGRQLRGSGHAPAEIHRGYSACPWGRGHRTRHRRPADTPTVPAPRTAADRALEERRFLSPPGSRPLRVVWNRTSHRARTAIVPLSGGGWGGQLYRGHGECLRRHPRP